jgi:hypothetical protein
MSSQTVALPARVQRAAGWIVVARDRLLAVRPLYVLSTLVALQWAAVAALAVTVRHNGWVYYMGGDQLWHYTSAYLLGRGHIAPTLVGVGWSTILTPISWLAGNDLVSALPAITLLNVLVLGPVALLCMYGIAERIGGRLFGYWATLLWIVLPYVGIRYALHGYHQKWTELTLPQMLGLGAMSDFPSMVALLVGAYFCLRAVDGGHWLWSAGAGFAIGYALAIKPSNTAILIAPALLFLVFRRRSIVPFLAGLAPPLFVLGFWKERGFGHLPAFSRAAPERRVAAGVGDVFKPLHKYTHDNSWTQLHNNLIQLREHLWSDRVLEFVVLAGIVALLIRSRRGGVFVGAWFVSFLLLKGTYLNARVEDATFWRLLLPAFPAFVLLVAAVPLLIPGVRLRVPVRRPSRISRRLAIGSATTAFALLVLFPTALIAAADPMHQPTVSALQVNATLVPVAPQLDLHASEQSGSVLVSWSPDKPSSSQIFYRVYRTPGSGSSNCVVTGHGLPDKCGPGQDDLVCRVGAKAPDNCLLSPAAQSIGTTRGRSWPDAPGAGTWIYRVGLSANWLNDPGFGDVYLFSRPVTVSVH